jgi:CBS domain-containing protein
MNVGRILAEKGHDVVTVQPAASVAEVVKTLARENVGAVVVTEGSSIRGILSERDIVRAMSRDGAAVLDKQASAVMTGQVVTCRPDETINEVMQKMTSGRFRHLPVVDRGRMVGIVSIGDVVKRRIEYAEWEAEQIREFITTA